MGHPAVCHLKLGCDAYWLKRDTYYSRRSYQTSKVQIYVIKVVIIGHKVLFFCCFFIKSHLGYVQPHLDA